MISDMPLMNDFDAAQVKWAKTLTIFYFIQMDS